MRVLVRAGAGASWLAAPELRGGSEWHYRWLGAWPASGRGWGCPGPDTAPALCHGTAAPRRVYRSQESLCSTFRAPAGTEIQRSLGVEGVVSGTRADDGSQGAAAQAQSGTDTCLAGERRYEDQDLLGGDLSGPGSYFVTLGWEDCCAYCADSSECYAW